MDDLLREFLTETSESLDTVDNQLVRFAVFRQDSPAPLLSFGVTVDDRRSRPPLVGRPAPMDVLLMVGVS